MEAAHLDPHLVGLRDSKHPDGVMLTVTTRDWATLLATH